MNRTKRKASLLASCAIIAICVAWAQPAAARFVDPILCPTGELDMTAFEAHALPPLMKAQCELGRAQIAIFRLFETTKNVFKKHRKYLSGPQKRGIRQFFSAARTHTIRLRRFQARFQAFAGLIPRTKQCRQARLSADRFEREIRNGFKYLETALADLNRRRQRLADSAHSARVGPGSRIWQWLFPEALAKDEGVTQPLVENHELVWPKAQTTQPEEIDLCQGGQLNEEAFRAHAKFQLIEVQCKLGRAQVVIFRVFERVENLYGKYKDYMSGSQRNRFRRFRTAARTHMKTIQKFRSRIQGLIERIPNVQQCDHLQFFQALSERVVTKSFEYLERANEDLELLGRRLGYNRTNTPDREGIANIWKWLFPEAMAKEVRPSPPEDIVSLPPVEGFLISEADEAELDTIQGLPVLSDTPTLQEINALIQALATIIAERLNDIRNDLAEDGAGPIDIFQSQ